MSRYSIGGLSLVTAATANHCAAQLWNPSTTKHIKVTAVEFAHNAATLDYPTLVRSSARGATPTATRTPTITNDYERKIAPPSGAVLELGTFTSQPTLDTATTALREWLLPAAVGAGIMFTFYDRPIEILPGAGLVICTLVATALQPLKVNFEWDE